MLILCAAINRKNVSTGTHKQNHRNGLLLTIEHNSFPEMVKQKFNFLRLFYSHDLISQALYDEI